MCPLLFARWWCHVKAQRLLAMLWASTRELGALRCLLWFRQACCLHFNWPRLQGPMAVLTPINNGFRTLDDLTVDVFKSETTLLWAFGLGSALLAGLLPQLVQHGAKHGSAIYKVLVILIVLCTLAGCGIYLWVFIINVLGLLHDWRLNERNIDCVLLTSDMSAARRSLFTVINFPEYAQVARTTKHMLRALFANALLENLANLLIVLILSYESIKVLFLEAAKGVKRAMSKRSGQMAEYADHALERSAPSAHVSLSTPLPAEPRKDRSACSRWMELGLAGLGTLCAYGWELATHAAKILLAGGIFALILIVPVWHKVGSTTSTADVVQKAAAQDCPWGAARVIEEFYLSNRHASGWNPLDYSEVPSTSALQVLHKQSLLNRLDNSLIRMLDSLQCTPADGAAADLEAGVVVKQVQSLKVSCHMSFNSINSTFGLQDLVSLGDWGYHREEAMFRAEGATGVYSILALIMVSAYTCTAFGMLGRKRTVHNRQLDKGNWLYRSKLLMYFAGSVAGLFVLVAWIIAGSVLVDGFSVKGRGDFSCMQMGNVLLITVEQLFREPVARLVMLTFGNNLLSVTGTYAVLWADIREEDPTFATLTSALSVAKRVCSWAWDKAKRVGRVLEACLGISENTVEPVGIRSQGSLTAEHEAAAANVELPEDTPDKKEPETSPASASKAVQVLSGVEEAHVMDMTAAGSAPGK